MAFLQPVDGVDDGDVPGLDASVIQGNRISNLSDEAGQEGIVPTGSFDFSAV